MTGLMLLGRIQDSVTDADWIHCPTAYFMQLFHRRHTSILIFGCNFNLNHSFSCRSLALALLEIS